MVDFKKPYYVNIVCFEMLSSNGLPAENGMENDENAQINVSVRNLS